MASEGDTIDCCFGTALLGQSNMGLHFHTLCVVTGMVPFQVTEKICCVSRLDWHRPTTYFAECLNPCFVGQAKNSARWSKAEKAKERERPSLLKKVAPSNIPHSFKPCQEQEVLIRGTCPWEMKWSFSPPRAAFCEERSSCARLDWGFRPETRSVLIQEHSQSDMLGEYVCFLQSLSLSISLSLSLSLSLCLCLSFLQG